MLALGVMVAAGLAHEPADPLLACRHATVWGVTTAQTSGETVLLHAYGDGRRSRRAAKRHHPAPPKWSIDSDLALRAVRKGPDAAEEEQVYPVKILERTAAPHRAQLLVRVEDLPPGRSTIELQRQTWSGWRRITYGRKYWHSREPSEVVLQEMPDLDWPPPPLEVGHPLREGVLACDGDGQTIVRSFPAHARAASIRFSSMNGEGEEALYSLRHDVMVFFGVAPCLYTDRTLAVIPPDAVLTITFIDDLGRHWPPYEVDLAEAPPCRALGRWSFLHPERRRVWCAERRSRVLDEVELEVLQLGKLSAGDGFDWTCNLGPGALYPLVHRTCEDGLEEAAANVLREAFETPWYPEPLATLEPLGSVPVDEVPEEGEAEGVPPEVLTAHRRPHEPDAREDLLAPPSWQIVESVTLSPDSDLALLVLDTPTGRAYVVQRRFRRYWGRTRGLGCPDETVWLFEVEDEVWSSWIEDGALKWGRWVLRVLE